MNSKGQAIKQYFSGKWKSLLKKNQQVFQSVAGGLLGAVRYIFAPVPCERCRILEDWLEAERYNNQEFKKLIFAQLGYSSDSIDPPVSRDDKEESVPVRRRTTLSNVRLAMESLSKAREARGPIIDERTPAEVKFEERINAVRS